MSIKLNLGCGHIRPQGWVNTDSSLNALLQRLPLGGMLSRVLGGKSYDNNNMTYMNLNKTWSYSSNSVDIVYASHLFEHLSIPSTRLFLAEAFRSLKSGGVIRLVMPDMYGNAKQYITDIDGGNTEALKHYMWVLNLHREGQYPRGNFMHSLLGWWQGYPHQHKFMYDYNSLEALFKEFGFVMMNRCDFGKSDYIPEIAEVEIAGGGYAHSLYLEAKKP